MTKDDKAPATADLMRKLLAVPKSESDETHREHPYSSTAPKSDDGRQPRQ
jgi:hypothetical protein